MTTTAVPDPADPVAVRSWTAHLRGGGTTTWTDWRARSSSSDPDGATDLPASRPSAAQLEVVRLLAVRSDPGSPDRDAFTALVDLVLAAPVGGRGAVDPRLAGSGPDPQELPAAALLRACVAALAALVESETPAEPPAQRRRMSRPQRVGVRVVGVTPHAIAVRAAVRAAGIGPGSRRATVLRVVAPLEAGVAGVWRRRVRAGSGVRWQRLWDGFAAHDRLPASLDLSGPAEFPGTRLLCATTPAAAVLATAELLGTDLDEVPAGSGHPVDTDLFRRLNQVLAARPEDVRRRPYTGRLAGSFGREYPGWPGVPLAHAPWAHGQGILLAERLAQSGLPVLGDPGVVVPSLDVRPRRIAASTTVDRALDVLTAQFEGGSPWRNA